ncbi:unnamed protein product [Lampetra planeri]
MCAARVGVKRASFLGAAREVKQWTRTSEQASARARHWSACSTGEGEGGTAERVARGAGMSASWLDEPHSAAFGDRTSGGRVGSGALAPCRSEPPREGSPRARDPRGGVRGLERRSQHPLQRHHPAPIQNKQAEEDEEDEEDKEGDEEDEEDEEDE